MLVRHNGTALNLMTKSELKEHILDCYAELETMCAKLNADRNREEVYHYRRIVSKLLDVLEEVTK